ncbi:SOS response-associated peptidase [Thermoleophilia bacterium SCSIO 60948]|nr:SOS response-associated peptidase [Thermoleophilia bacterium SCSIO 60948]
MCGRYTLGNPDPATLQRRFELRHMESLQVEPHFNLAPTDPVLAIRRDSEGEREPGMLRWGLVPGRWAESGRPLINARAETIDSQPAFAESFRERRCLMAADGFYEWRRDERGKVPIWFSRPDGEPFAFAGVWAEIKGSDGATITSCALATTEPNELMRPVHDRMPVVLDPRVEGTWLDPSASLDDLRALLVPAAEDALIAREVSDLVNSNRNDGPELIAPRPQEQTLF